MNNFSHTVPVAPSLLPSLLTPLLTITLPSRLRVLARVIRLPYPFRRSSAALSTLLRPVMTRSRHDKDLPPTDDVSDGTTGNENDSPFDESDDDTDNTDDTVSQSIGTHLQTTLPETGPDYR
jgi:hypothetical protein